MNFWEMLIYFGTAFFYLAQQPPVGQGFLIHEIYRSHSTTHHSRWDSSGRVISSSQSPLPDNTQHSQQTDIHAPGGIRTHIPASELPQTYALDQCFSTAGPWPGTGPWHQLYRAARGSPGICHFTFLSIFRG